MHPVPLFKILLKIAINSEAFAKFARKYPLARRLFVYKITHISNVKDFELRSELYDAVYTEGQTAKSTRVKRFEDIDEESIKLLYPDNNVVHDIAVSNGVTSVELFDRIRQSGKKAEFYISDKFSQYYYAGGCLTRVFSSNKRMLCGYVCFILADNHISRAFFISHMLFYILNILPVPQNLIRISLYDEKTKAYLAKRLLKELYFDVFDTKIEQQFTFVRCMNLLQPVYFDEEKIKTALKNIKLSLKDAGIFQAGRTMQDGTNDVSFYRKTGNRLVLLHHLNKGYECNKLVEAV